MKNKKLISILLVLVLIFVPLMAVAEESALEAGSFTLKLSDPIINLPAIVPEDAAMMQDQTDSESGDPANVEIITQDLTGLAVQIGGVLDASDAENPMGLLSLMMLVMDDPAASAMIGYNKDEVYALINGVSSVITMSMEDLQKLVESSTQEAGLSNAITGGLTGMETMSSLLDGLSFTEGPAEQVEFYSTSGEYPRNSLHLTSEQLQDALQTFGSELPEGTSCDISYFTDDGENMRIEGTLNDIVQGATPENANLNFELMTESLEDGTLNVRGNVGISGVAFTLNLNGRNDPTYPDYYGVDAILEVNGEDGINGQLQLSLAPNVAQDGVVSEMFSVTLTSEDMQLLSLQTVSRVTESDESYSMYFAGSVPPLVLTADYSGTIEQSDTDRIHAGQVIFEMIENDKMTVSGKVNVNLNLSKDVEGKFPNISSMTKLDYAQIDDEQEATLMTELQMAGIQALGKLMTLPSLAQLISSSMGAITGE